MGDWLTNGQGDLSLISTIDSNDPNHVFALKVSQRNDIHVGPKHGLNVACFEINGVIEIRSKIKLVNSTSQEPYECDSQAGAFSTCPVLTLEYITDSAKLHTYARNEDLAAWHAEEFNTYHGFFEISPALTQATEAYFYFEKPPVGVDMIIDDVEVREFQPVPLENIHLEGDDFVYANCNEIVTNGDAEVSQYAIQASARKIVNYHSFSHL